MPSCNIFISWRWQTNVINVAAATRATSNIPGASISSVCLSCLKLRNVCTRPTRGDFDSDSEFRLRFHRRRCKPIYLVAHQTVKSYTCLCVADGSDEAPRGGHHGSGCLSPLLLLLVLLPVACSLSLVAARQIIQMRRQMADDACSLRLQPPGCFRHLIQLYFETFKYILMSLCTKLSNGAKIMSAASSAISTHMQMCTLLAHGVHNSHSDTQPKIQRDIKSEIQIQTALQIQQQWSTLHQFQCTYASVCVSVCVLLCFKESLPLPLMESNYSDRQASGDMRPATDVDVNVNSSSPLLG